MSCGLQFLDEQNWWFKNFKKVVLLNHPKWKSTMVCFGVNHLQMMCEATIEKGFDRHYGDVARSIHSRADSWQVQTPRLVTLDAPLFEVVHHDKHR